MPSKQKRLVKNTLILYMRTLIAMLISLYSVRVVIDALGVEDYGIQNVISGFVSMFSFVTGSLSVAISRFMSIEIERRNKIRLSQVFSSSSHIMILVSVLVIIVVETFGVWFLNKEMNISSDRMYAANWVLQFSMFTLIVSLLSVPFDALIISYEKMSAFAYINILSNVLKLGIAFLIFISPFDKLVFYALLLLVQSIIIRFCYGAYCVRHFADVKLDRKVNKPIVKSILSLAGWDLWGSSSYILKNYGVNIVLNIFCGPIVNAARGIALQVNTAVTQFSGGFLTALRPQVIKTYVSGEKEVLWEMVDSGTKFATFLLLFLSMPIMLECHYILKLWLGNVPEHTVNFVLLTIILSMSEGSLIYTQNTVMIANGNIKLCQLITGIIQLLNIPFAFILLKMNSNPESTIVLAIVIAHCCCFIRSVILSKLTGYSTANFFRKVYVRIILTSVIIYFPLVMIRNQFQEGFTRLLMISMLSLVWSCFVILFVGCDGGERKYVIGKIGMLISKLGIR